MEAIRSEGVVYLRTISQHSPWVIQSQPSEEELLAVDGDLLGMCGDSGDMASNPVARALGVVPRDVVYMREAGVIPPMPPCGRR